MDKKKLKIGIIIDNKTVNYEERELINFIIKNDILFLKPIILSQTVKNQINKNPISSKLTKLILKIFKGEFSDILHSIFLRIINKIEINKLNNNYNFKNYKKEFQIDDFSLEHIKILPTISRSGLVFTYSDEIIGEIKNYKFDILIRCGSGILKGKILHSSKYGIISFHHGDNRYFRGSPPGFWETYYNVSTTGFIIQKLNEVLDGGNIIFNGSIRTKYFWYENYAILFKKSFFFMKKLLVDVAKNPELLTNIKDEKYIYSNKIYRNPNSYELFLYILKKYPPKILEKIISKIFKLEKQPEWSVSFQKDSAFEKPMYKSQKILNPIGSFLADPFVINYMGKNFCFVEEYIYRDRKGRISVVELKDNQSYSYLGSVLEENYHLSFPFIFNENNEYFMIPETHEKREVRVYKTKNFPFDWTYSHTILKNVDAVDSVIIKKDKKYFLLTNICSDNLNQHDELHMYYTENFFSENWKSCKSNPVIFDPLKARNGGIFSHKLKIYRVNQVHEGDIYGRGFEINELIDISVNNFVEKKLFEVKPNFEKNIIATHHYHSNGIFTVFDTMKYRKNKINL